MCKGQELLKEGVEAENTNCLGWPPVGTRSRPTRTAFRLDTFHAPCLGAHWGSQVASCG